MTRRARRMAMLAELTHRCPLACPYCSNPVELTRAVGELTPPTGPMSSPRRPISGCCNCTFGRRARLAARPRGARRRGPRGRALRQPDHLRHRPDRAAAGGAGRRRARPCAAVAAGDRRRDGRPDRRLSRRLRAQDARWRAGCGALGLPLTLNAVMHRQNLTELAETIDARARARGAAASRWRRCSSTAGRALNRAALMPTRDQATRGGAGGRRGAGAAEGRARDRLRARRPSRALSQGLHGRLGLDRAQRRARGAGPALPRGADDPGPRASSRCATAPLEAIWETAPAFSAFRGDRLDARALRCCERKLDRFRRLPLPGDGAGRRSGGDRSGLRQVAASRGACRGGRGRRRSGPPGPFTYSATPPPALTP